MGSKKCGFFHFSKSNKLTLLLLHPVWYSGLKKCSGSFPAHGFRCQLLSLIPRQLKALPHNVFAQPCQQKLVLLGKVMCSLQSNVTSSEGGHLLSFIWSSSYKILRSSSAQAFLMPETASISQAVYDLHRSSVTWDLSSWLLPVFSSSWTGRFCTLRHK